MNGILALDLGNQTGWACALRDRIEHGHIRWEPSKGAGTWERYIGMRTWLEEAYERWGFSLIAFERPFLRGKYSNEALIGYKHEVKVFAAAYWIDIVSVQATTLKKAIARDGHASKDDMKRVVEGVFDGLVGCDDNEIDALAVLLYALWLEDAPPVGDFEVFEYESILKEKEKWERKRKRRHGRQKGLFGR